MRIIFMGTPSYAEDILKVVIDNSIDVVAVYTQPDKPVGRKKLLTSSPVKILALKNAIEVYQPNKLRDKESIKKLLEIECDYIVVAAYGQILPKEILAHAPCVNLHASILPKLRGASPIQQTLLNGDDKTGVTAMLMDKGLDTGDILKIETIDVGEDEMVESLFKRLTEVASTLTIDIIKNFDLYTPIKQDDSLSTHCSKITKKDGEVSFINAIELYNKYRAFTPWPAVYLKNGLKLKKIKIEDRYTKNENGKIIAIDKDSIVVGCEIGSIRLFRVQSSSKKEMDILSYINGKRLNIEDTLS